MTPLAYGLTLPEYLAKNGLTWPAEDDDKPQPGVIVSCDAGLRAYLTLDFEREASGRPMGEPPCRGASRNDWNPSRGLAT